MFSLHITSQNVNNTYCLEKHMFRDRTHVLHGSHVDTLGVKLCIPVIICAALIKLTYTQIVN